MSLRLFSALCGNLWPDAHSLYSLAGDPGLRLGFWGTFADHNPIVVEFDEKAGGRLAACELATFEMDDALGTDRRGHQFASLACRLLAVLRPVGVRAPADDTHEGKQEQRPPPESEPSSAVFGHASIVADERYNRSDPCY